MDKEHFSKVLIEQQEKGKFQYYEWDYRPYLVDKDQADVHIGGINMAETLEDLLFRINMYKNEIREIKEVKPSPDF